MTYPNPHPAKRTPKSRDALITEHLNFARRLAMKSCRKLRGGSDYDDFLGYAYQGLVEAADRYDSSRHATFTTFAYKRIMGSMVDGIGKLAPFSRGISRGHDEAQREALFAKAHYPISDAEESAEVHVLGKEMRSLLEKSISSLAPHKQRIIQERYFEEKNLEASADAQGKSISWASRLHKKTLAELRKKMNQEHVSPLEVAR